MTRSELPLPNVLARAVGRTQLDRLARAQGGLRAVQQLVLSSFATTGHAPSMAAIQTTAADHERSAADVLAELDHEDYLALTDGQIRAAYPFSAVPTAHRVRLASGVDVYAMCAIDALGIPAMLDTDATVTSTDPQTGDPVTVTFTRGRVAWDPRTAVVYVGQRGPGGPTLDICCRYLNFFTDTHTAAAWINAHPEVTGSLLTQAQARDLGEAIFAPLLTGHAGT
jgi:hypothetical protein